MKTSMKIIQFPMDTSIGQLFLVDAKRLPEKYQSATRLAVDHLTAGSARGKRTIVMSDEQKLLLEIDQNTFIEGNLSHCSGLEAVDIVSGIKTGDQLDAVVHYMPSVRGLSFPCHHEISIAAYAGISKLSKLEYLNMLSDVIYQNNSYLVPFLPPDCLSGMNNLKMVVFPSEACLDLVEGLPNLEKVVIYKSSYHLPGGWRRLKPKFWEEARNLQKLKSLSLLDANLAANDLENIASIESLESLTIELANFDHEFGRFRGIERLGELTGLRSLKVHALREWPLEVTARMQNLEELCLEFYPSDEDSKWIGKLANLKELAVASPGYERGVKNISPELIANIAGLRTLERLRLSHAESVTSIEIEQLKDLQNLEELDLNDSYVDDSALKAIATHLRGLLRLDLSHRYTKSGISNSGISCLRNLSKLRRLNLGRQRVDNTGLEAIGKLFDLEWLDIECSVATNAGIEALLPLSKLRYLNLADSKLIDNGVIPILEKFSNLASPGNLLMTGLSREARGYMSQY